MTRELTDDEKRKVAKSLGMTVEQVDQVIRDAINSAECQVDAWNHSPAITLPLGALIYYLWQRAVDDRDGLFRELAACLSVAFFVQSEEELLKELQAIPEDPNNHYDLDGIEKVCIDFRARELQRN